MKIGLAQIQSFKGEINKNINKHFFYIKKAIDVNCDVIVFPELSITNYEPTIAKDFATTINNEKFNQFQELAKKHKITICIGMPTKLDNKILISMLIFKPNSEKNVYSKNRLHKDELPFFSSENCTPILEINNQKLGIGICFETLQKEHIKETVALGATLFIASVSKPNRGIDKAYLNFSSSAKELDLPILMVNAIGTSDDFIANGNTAIWNTKGKLLNQLNNKNEGLLIYDTELKTSEKIYTN